MTVWDEWGALTRFLESARIAFARERNLWHALELADREAVTINAPASEHGRYAVSLGQHIAAVDDEVTLHASVLIHSYALTESTICGLLGVSPRRTNGIEDWATRALEANGRSWDSVQAGLPGAVEVAVVRNAFAHGTRTVDAQGAKRLQAVGTQVSAGQAVTLTYEELREYRIRLRGILRYGGADPKVSSSK
ncbi:hypothetical protein [Nocardioides sp. LS1]|uniref:hypothetical protein n=1 Tax=Nocardioides sp. LS1 TaxID=1027620 RepID=UPI000F620852|nr:hypothetical protein [Nocardioides sp. LS1]GCD88076.1 hypothetical protein NLS1_00820 [Nocardioides sp. LS1]